MQFLHCWILLHISCEWMIHPSFFLFGFSLSSRPFSQCRSVFSQGKLPCMFIVWDGEEVWSDWVFSEIIYYVRMVFNTYESSSESHLVKFIQSLVLLFLYSTTFIRLSCSSFPSLCAYWLMFIDAVTIGVLWLVGLLFMFYILCIMIWTFLKGFINGEFSR